MYCMYVLHTCSTEENAVEKRQLKTQLLKTHFIQIEVNTAL